MLAGVGCKDYDDDIKEINNKIEGLETGKLASLEEQLNSLKVTISTLEQADKVVDALKEIVARLRSMSPLYDDFLAQQNQ